MPKLLEVLVYPDPRLSQPALPVEKPESLQELVEDLIHTMYAHEGAGIAATQVGRREAVFVLDPQHVGGWPQDPPMVFINPALQLEKDVKLKIEGCLSFPGVRGTMVPRHSGVRIKAQDLTGTWFELQAEGFLAQAIQHEFDHLVGQTMVDRVGPLAKKAILRQLRM